MNHFRYTTFLFLLLSGCMVGPRYHKPEMAMPSQFESTPKEAASGQKDPGQWWKQFNDPVLDGLIEEALNANYDLQIALEKIGQARAEYRIERSHLWPEIDLNATATRTRISQNLLPEPSTPQPTPAGNAPTASSAGSSFLPKFLNIFQVGFDAIWEFDFFGKFRHFKNAAHHLWEASKDDYQNVQIMMLSEVAVNYVSLRALQNKIELLDEKIEADEKELEITESLFEIGIDNEMQITTLISSIETDRAELPVLKTSLKQTVYTLAYLLGRQPEGMMDLFADVQPIPVADGKLPIGLPSDLLRQRPDVRSAERQLAAATEQTGAAMADYFPHFALTGVGFTNSNKVGSSAGFESSKLNKLFKSGSRMFSVGIGMNLNVLDFGRLKGNLDSKNSQQKQALMTYEQTVIASLKDVESALVAYYEEQNRRESLLQKVEADYRTFEITQDLFAVGIVNEIQVLHSQKALLDSRRSFVESEQSLTGDFIAIYKAIGGNWDEETSKNQQ